MQHVSVSAQHFKYLKVLIILNPLLNRKVCLTRTEKLRMLHFKQEQYSRVWNRLIYDLSAVLALKSQLKFWQSYWRSDIWYLSLKRQRGFVLWYDLGGAAVSSAGSKGFRGWSSFDEVYCCCCCCRRRLVYFKVSASACSAPAPRTHPSKLQPMFRAI